MDGNFEHDVEYLGEMKALTVLDINFQLHSFMPMVNSLVKNQTPINSLSIRQYSSLNGNAFDEIVKLKQIKILKIFTNENGIENAHIIQLAKELPQLHQLHLGYFFGIKFDVDVLNTVVSFATRHHFKGKKLKVRFELQAFELFSKMEASSF